MEFTILDEGRAISLSGEDIHVSTSGATLLSQTALRDQLGWDLKPEGLCRNDNEVDLCIPIRNRDALVQDERVDLAGFADVVGRPVVIDREQSIAAFGTAADSQVTAMASLEAPDFKLPDLSGRMHTLSEHRGKKVLFIAYASW